MRGRTAGDKPALVVAVPITGLYFNNPVVTDLVSKDFITTKRGWMTYKITLEEHQATIRSLPVAACLVDKQLIYLSVSDRYADLFGATVDQLIGRSMVGIVPDSVISGFQGDFEALENGLETATDELVIDGRMYLATIHPLRHETGAMIATFVTLTDISPFKRRIEDLSGKFERLQSFTSKLQELAGTDELTSLPNRRGMERFVYTEMRRCRREQKAAFRGSDRHRLFQAIQ
ncbi:PAS domain-containing protein [Ochrobactrum haematophilum]|uniref:PAS domain-containing protein n=1 Tax=Brucella haematophila TaxID=419474 RepID=A0ABX1DR43_9HYPH|nr:PAS domain-containing protein [Brucella haematophila]